MELEHLTTLHNKGALYPQPRFQGSDMNIKIKDQPHTISVGPQEQELSHTVTH